MDFLRTLTILLLFTYPLTTFAISTNPSEIITHPTEGDSNHVNYILLQINRAKSRDISVDYYTRNMTAEAGLDYIETIGTAIIKSGETQVLIGVEIIADNIIENNEEFEFVIHNPIGANFPTGVTEFSVKRTIVDDDLEKLPLISISDLEYEGGFRIKSGTFGDSKSGWSNGKIAYNPDKHSIFITGHTYDDAIAEFEIPNFDLQTDLEKLPITNAPIQPFIKILDSPYITNTQNINELGGIEYIDGQLLIHGYKYYDANGEVTQTSIMARNANNLSVSILDGFYEVDSKAHCVLWNSPIPNNMKEVFGGDYLCGASSAMPINGRLSMGPSAFVFDSESFLNTSLSPGKISTVKLLDYTLEHTLIDNIVEWSTFSDFSILYNYFGENLPGKDFLDSYDVSLVGDNHLWTEASAAHYGLIIPGTRTYAVFGFSGMHNSGGGYKIMRESGQVCAGPCPFDPEDFNNYYWFYKISDLLSVKNNKKIADEVLPYAYGVFNTPFNKIYDKLNEKNFKPVISGGTYDVEKQKLYFSMSGADKIQSKYDPSPLIIVYKVKL